MRKNAKKYITIQCKACGKDVVKQKREYDRLVMKRGQVNFYCNNSCSYQDNKAAQSQIKWVKDNPEKALERLNKKPRKYQKKDELSPFRYALCKVRTRISSKLTKNFELDLTAEDLKSQFDKQNGICPYTGITMDMVKQHTGAKLTQMSLDRIDSSRGYVKDNVEFVCLGVNYAKNGFSKQEMLDFVNQIRNS